MTEQEDSIANYFSLLLKFKERVRRGELDVSYIHFDSLERGVMPVGSFKLEHNYHEIGDRHNVYAGIYFMPDNSFKYRKERDIAGSIIANNLSFDFGFSLEPKVYHEFTPKFLLKQGSRYVKKLCLDLFIAERYLEKYKALSSIIQDRHTPKLKQAN